MVSKRPQLFPLTSLRFFLAIWVVVHHETEYRSNLLGGVGDVYTPLYNFARTGYLAVGVFFVLSGFVLAYNYSLGQSWTSEGRKRFAVARFARIYPAYCAGLLLLLPFIAKGLYNRFTGALAIHQAFAAALNWTLLQAWFPRFALTWNAPGWSLSNEAFFYACFPFIGVLLWRLSRLRTLLTGYFLVWAASLVVPLIVVVKGVHGLGDISATTVNLGLHPRLEAFVIFNPLLQLPYFCAGIVLARIYGLLQQSNHWLIGRGYWIYLPGFVLEGLAILAAGRFPLPLYRNGLLLPLHGCVILGLALGGGFLARGLSARVFIFLGDASYAIYILHNPINTWMQYITTHLHLHLSDASLAAIYFTIVILASSAFFQWVEKPANKYLRVRLGSWLGRRNDTPGAAPQPAVL